MRGDFLWPLAAVDEEQDGHAHGQAICDLFQHERPFSISNFAVDFHAAIDWAGVHDQSIGFTAVKPSFVEAEQISVLADTGEHGLALAFVLDAQQVDYICVFDRLIYIMGHPAAHLFENFGHERTRTAQSYVCAEFEQGPNIRSCHATIKDITEDRDVEAFDPFLMFTNRESIEQRLRRMFMGAIASIDDTALEKSGEEMRGSRGAVANDDNVGVECLEIAGGVLQRLAFLERRSFGGEVNDVCREPQGGEFKTD